MSFRSLLLLRILSRQRHKLINAYTTQNYASNTMNLHEKKFEQYKEFKTEQSFKSVEDSDTFGSLSGNVNRKFNDILEEDGDIQEQKYLQHIPLPTQKLTVKQYSDIIKQYLKYKRLKEAINVLEVKMLQEDRVKPDNYIYNILIGACADVGFTKKAFKLFNDMKKRALMPTGDTYTCLFQACINSPWPADGLKYATHLRNIMIEKGIEPNITNYNVMIKAFGRCGDIQSAFKIVDEMIARRIKIRVHTFNHLLHACIADKKTGLRHALVVWQKMLSMREKPNIYTFNLMLKCTKDCNLGSKEDIQDLISEIQNQILSSSNRAMLQLGSSDRSNDVKINSVNNKDSQINKYLNSPEKDEVNKSDRVMEEDKQNVNNMLEPNKEMSVVEMDISKSLTILPKNYKLPSQSENRSVPNLLSKVLRLNQVLSLRKVHSLQDKFQIIGGQEDFIKEMEIYNVKPDIKIFTQMLPLIEESRDAENKIMETMKSLNVKPDVDFINMLIKKRCIRMDYDGAFLIKQNIERDYQHANVFKRKKILKPNILTYGVLAMACKTKEDAEKLLNEMKEKQLKVNIEILGTLLRNGTAHNNFEYVLYIMDTAKEENLKPNEILIKHLQSFISKCKNISQTDDSFIKTTKKILKKYKNWIEEMKVTEIKTEHPWKQFTDTYPETVQRQNIEITIPKRFYKRNRKYVRYAPKT